MARKAIQSVSDNEELSDFLSRLGAIIDAFCEQLALGKSQPYLPFACNAGPTKLTIPTMAP